MHPSSSRDERILALIDRAYKEWDEEGMIRLDTMADLEAAGIDHGDLFSAREETYGHDDGQPDWFQEWYDFDPDC